MADVELVIKVPEHCFEELKCVKLNESNEGVVFHAIKCILNGIPLPKGYGDLIDRSKLEVCSIDITDLPTDKGLMVYYAEDVDNAPAIIEADNESEAADL